LADVGPRTWRRRSLHAAALGAGVLVALSLPPWGFWPLAFVGIAGFAFTVSEPLPARQRFLRGLLFGAGWMSIGMFWMIQLTLPGYLIAVLLFASLHGVAALVGGSGRWAVLRRPLAHTLVEALRFSFPFGGVPLASLGISQVAGPLAGVARVGGVVLLTWVVFQIGFSITANLITIADRPASRQVGVAALGGLGTALVALLLSVVAPTGAATGETLRVAAVQGGGEQGTSALEVPSSLVTERHLEATRTVEPPVDLVLWPENTIDVTSFPETPIHQEIAAQARRLDAPIAVGVTEDTADGSNFTNAQVVVDPGGEIVSRYDKVRRVPFGEYVPLRGLLEALGAPLDQIRRDAVAGTGPAYVELPDGTRLATVISWEVFFGGRVRDGVREGAEAIINPTNGASYTGTIVQTQQVASSRLRAIETGRWLVQASPTGFTAIIDHEGDVLERTAVSERRVVTGTIELRTGLTWYTRMGDAPIIGALIVALLLVIWLDRRTPEALRAASSRSSRSEIDDEGDRPVVDELDTHLGTESAGGDVEADGSQRGDH
jgi:apolipoprotein N-acyltransferase